MQDPDFTSSIVKHYEPPEGHFGGLMAHDEIAQIFADLKRQNDQLLSTLNGLLEDVSPEPEQIPTETIANYKQ
jgi:hypothetical protein